MDVLDLLFRRLVLAARAAGALERPVTVGELLDQFVPYAAARRDGGLDSHDDYLHAVMRLCAGERDLLFVDDLMQDDLRAELASPNPDLSALRTYASTKVRLSTTGVDRVLAGDTNIDLRPPTPLTPSRRVSAPAPMPGPATTGEAPATPPPAPRPSRPSGGEPMTEPRPSGGLLHAFAAYEGSRGPDTAAGASADGTADPGCPYCALTLPTGRTIKFCPGCGQNLLVRRCPGCSAEIEHGWTFCVTCGRKA